MRELSESESAGGRFEPDARGNGMPARRSPRLVVLAPLGALLVALLFGYFIGSVRGPSSGDLQRARKEAQAERERGEKAAQRSYRRGLSTGRRRGIKEGERRARAELAAQQGQGTANGGTGTGQAPAGCAGGFYTGPDGTCRPIPPGYGGSPPANSPEGRQRLQQDPDCQGLPQPSPTYTGPVQC